jgi:hypothetical protein
MSSKIIPNTKPVYEYETRVIAYVDILGFKNIIKDSSKNNDKINDIMKALQYLKNVEEPNEWNTHFIEFEEDAQKKGLENFDISETLCCSCFSDTIVVSAVASDGNIHYVVSTLIANLAYTSSYLLTSGILLRGSITYGKLIHQRNGLIMGQGLVEAYEIESTIAKFPRIVLSNKLLDKLNYPFLAKKDRYPYPHYIERFSDGCAGFHPMIFMQVLQTSTAFLDGEIENILSTFRSFIVKGLNASFEHPDVYAKYKWFVDRYDNLIVHNKDLKPPIDNDIRHINFRE